MAHAWHMPVFLIHHRHDAHECGAAFAAFKGSESPMRHHEALATCRYGGHDIWWLVEAPGAPEALALLPWFLARRATAARVAPVEIP